MIKPLQKYSVIQANRTVAMRNTLKSVLIPGFAQETGPGVI
ncbi:hypothetical protein Mpet_1120 [Methanolacinia petrolearia DSM 11571]|uniref:Uncharacterized protein n=1 Tax=Methanolacinia petrolearia (strain DSM 11571 / OCM 486 / SEBR 4847) TaxID=679926 RepID=E1RCY6_METP4|nr:hypothetical protein Mpet_1120 [Methanolacinia petrolearia DSM 11571]